MADENRKNAASSVGFRVAIAVLNVFIAVVVPLLVYNQRSPPFSKGETYLFAVLLLIALFVFESWTIAERAYAKELRLTRIWDARQKLDSRLQEVRRLFHEVEEGKKGDVDLFASYFDHRLLNLENDLRAACSKKQVQIDDTMLQVTTWLLQSSFRGGPKDVFRAVHLAADNDFFFDVHARRYFAQMKELVSSNKAVAVQRLIVYRDQTELDDLRTKKLIAFHQHHKHYDVRLLPRTTFNTFLRDYQLHHVVQDFGVYGETYLYKGLMAKTDEIVGQYSKDETEILRFSDCFDTCWESAEVPEHDDIVHQEGATSDVSLAWLYG